MYVYAYEYYTYKNIPKSLIRNVNPHVNESTAN